MLLLHFTGGKIRHREFKSIKIRELIVRRAVSPDLILFYLVKDVVSYVIVSSNSGSLGD